MSTNTSCKLKYNTVINCKCHKRLLLFDACTAAHDQFQLSAIGFAFHTVDNNNNNHHHSDRHQSTNTNIHTNDTPNRNGNSENMSGWESFNCQTHTQLLMYYYYLLLLLRIFLFSLSLCVFFSLYLWIAIVCEYIGMCVFTHCRLSHFLLINSIVVDVISFYHFYFGICASVFGMFLCRVIVFKYWRAHTVTDWKRTVRLLFYKIVCVCVWIHVQYLINTLIVSFYTISLVQFVGPHQYEMSISYDGICLILWIYASSSSTGLWVSSSRLFLIVRILVHIHVCIVRMDNIESHSKLKSHLAYGVNNTEENCERHSQNSVIYTYLAFDAIRCGHQFIYTSSP